MEFKNVGFLITEDCNAKCKMCCDSRGLVQGKTVNEADLNIVLSNIKDCVKIESIGITGGEPMLYKDIVKRILLYDYDRVMITSIKTNGSWGKDIESARDLLKEVSGKLHQLSFSYDEFHKEYININYIKNLLDIAFDLRLNTEIVGCFLKEGYSPSEMISDFDNYAYLTNFLFQPVIKTGSADFFEDKQFIKLLDTSKHDVFCPGFLESQILINANLDVYPCCSQVVENTILRVGNLKESSLGDILESLKTNYIFYTMYIYGFKPFINFMDENNIKYPTKLSSPCELCEFLFKDEWFMRELNEKKFF